ncbi:MAG: hypothetical protein CMN78_03550 [Spirochaetales bacterium]|nr:hypothetical protein [Spirochaetales bacterium]
MRSNKTIILAITIIVLICATASAERFSISTAYTAPIGNESIDPNFGLGVEYRFWGVFAFSINMYNDVVLGADNILNVQQIRPAGIFSGGVGMKIPLGGFHLLLDWQKFFTGTVAEQGVFILADSYAFGVSLDLSDYFAIEVRSRRLFNFSEKAIQDPGLRIASTDDTVDLLSIGASFHLF